jgi:glycine dehydrogenase subunit 1
MNPYLPSTEAERAEMMRAIEVKGIEELLSQIPAELRWRPGAAAGEIAALGRALSEPELAAEARRLAAANCSLENHASFLGAGIYHHYIPSVVTNLASRTEFLTAYTPYQPEASQGLLQAIFEYQTYIARLTDMDIANAGLYDGATALAEGVLMGLNIRPKARRVVLARSIHPHYRRVVHSHLAALEVEVVEVEAPEGVVDAADWKKALGPDGTTAVAAFQSPNFFGCIESGQSLVEAAHQAGAVAVVAFNPIALGILATPGQWGADIAVGEGQPLGMAPAAGGETLGLFATRTEHVWKMPGRLVGLTHDRKQRRAYVLTLQSREQHIRRARATSNICSNQSLYAIMATIYLATLGPEGLRELATLCARRCDELRRRLAAISGFAPAFAAPVFHEFVLRTGRDAKALADEFHRTYGILPGYPLGTDYPELADALLVCVTEMTPPDAMDRLADALAKS